MFLNKKKRSFTVGGLNNAGPGANGMQGGQGLPIEDLSAPDVEADPLVDARLRELEMRNLVGQYDAQVPKQTTSKGLADPSLSDGELHAGVASDAPPGVTTYGWKMYEKEVEKRDKIMRAQDVERVLQRLREEAASGPEGQHRVANILRGSESLSDDLQLAVAQTDAGGFGGNTGSGSFS